MGAITAECGRGGESGVSGTEAGPPLPVPLIDPFNLHQPPTYIQPHHLPRAAAESAESRSRVSGIFGNHGEAARRMGNLAFSTR